MSDDLWQMAERLHKTRFWKTGSVEQTYALLLMGRELGIPPTMALSGITLTMGKPTLGASLVGSLIQRSGRYRYHVTEITDQVCSINFFERDPENQLEPWRNIGTSRFTVQDADKADLRGGRGGMDTWKKYGRNMLLARALTNGARWYTPSIFGGAVYTPDELQPGSESGVESGGIPEQNGVVVTASAPWGPVTIDRLMELYTADQIMEATGGTLPATTEELEAVAERLWVKYKGEWGQQDAETEGAGDQNQVAQAVGG